jgi:hypothetical protein
MLLHLFATLARAGCVVGQEAAGDALLVRVQGVGQACARLRVLGPGTVDRVWLEHDGRRRRLDNRDHMAAVPGGVEVGVPEAQAGDTVVVRARPAGELTLAAGALPAPVHPAPVSEVVRYELQEPHPAWGFADSRRGTMIREWSAAGRTERIASSPAAPLMVVDAAPGTLELVAPNVVFAWSADPGVTAAPTEQGLLFRLPQAGRVRWRAVSAAGEAVVPDAATWREGLDWHFAAASLPEPAVPMALRGNPDRRALVRSLLALARELRPGSLPGRPATSPRPLNKAWKSGWATPIERALILDRMLGQERVEADWVLTGEAADAGTLTGFDQMLIVARVEGETWWLDPSCAVCRPLEISTRWMGRPAVGAADRVPVGRGTLTRRLSLEGDTFTTRVEATGSAALWLAERAAEGALPASLGVPGAAVVSAEGTEPGGEETGSRTAAVALRGTAAPRPIFPDGATPWEGGWADE